MLRETMGACSSKTHSESATRPESLTALLELRSSRTPARTAFTFASDGEDGEVAVTYAELSRRAREIGCFLQGAVATGSRVLLLFPPGSDFIAGFFGCLYGGVIAVPTYPPDPRRFEVTLSRLQAIARDAGVSLVLTTSEIGAMMKSLGISGPLAAIDWVSISDARVSETEWRVPEIGPETIAYLQYTSGSTGVPRGVMVSHGNLIANLKAIQHHFEHDEDSRGVIWLPPYHDMGLIGGLLQPVFSGFPTTLLSPLAFLQEPVRWLQAISRARGTVSGGPNFAYDLCVRRISVEDRKTLDLSSWTLAFSGAETVRQETLDRFVAAFEPCGFRREAFYPCYGLAEATLMVSGGEKSRPPIARSVDRGLLKSGRAVQVPEDSTSQLSLVSSGRAVREHEVRIVDPQTMRERADGEIGEIWVAGPSVGAGYWNRRDESQEVFHARLESVDTEFLRTGDLGFVNDGQLFVTGRLKDVIIIRGRNHYPDDIEASVQQSHYGLRRCGAAFSVPIAGEERLVVVQAVDPSLADSDGAIRAVRRVVGGRHGVKVAVVAFVASRSIPRTSSGKVRRSACRQAFLEGHLETTALWRDPKIFIAEQQAHEEALPLRLKRALVEAGVRYEVAPRPRQAIACRDVAQLSGRGLEQIIKTLVVRSIDGRFALAVLPGDRTLSLEKVSRALGAEASDLASTTEATRVTGYPIGGITPIGCADSGLAVLADHSLVALGKSPVNVGAGRPDIGLEIGADELLHLSSARCVDICLASTDGAFV